MDFAAENGTAPPAEKKSILGKPKKGAMAPAKSAEEVFAPLMSALKDLDAAAGQAGGNLLKRAAAKPKAAGKVTRTVKAPKEACLGEAAVTAKVAEAVALASSIKEKLAAAKPAAAGNNAGMPAANNAGMPAVNALPTSNMPTDNTSLVGGRRRTRRGRRGGRR
jgi:hypothetical protein